MGSSTSNSSQFLGPFLLLILLVLQNLVFVESFFGWGGNQIWSNFGQSDNGGSSTESDCESGEEIPYGNDMISSSFGKNADQQQQTNNTDQHQQTDNTDQSVNSQQQNSEQQEKLQQQIQQQDDANCAQQSNSSNLDVQQQQSSNTEQQHGQQQQQQQKDEVAFKDYEQYIKTLFIAYNQTKEQSLQRQARARLAECEHAISILLWQGYGQLMYNNGTSCRRKSGQQTNGKESTCKKYQLDTVEMRLPYGKSSICVNAEEVPTVEQVISMVQQYSYTYELITGESSGISVSDSSSDAEISSAIGTIMRRTSQLQQQLQQNNSSRK